MENSIIKSKFLDIEEKYPFTSGEFFSFFKYSRHTTFKRYLDNPKFYDKIQFHGFELVQERRSDIIRLSREMFIYICKKQNIDVIEYETYLLDYYKALIDKATTSFVDLKKNDRNHNLKLYFRPAGKFYNHSLNTINLSIYINVCPFEVFKFCSETLIYNLNPIGQGFEGGTFGRPITPYFHFDSKIYQERHEYLHLIREFKEKFFLTVKQKILVQYYYDAVKKMLIKQIGIEHKKQAYAEKSKKQREKRDKIKFTDKQLKDLYRKGSMLFHPDKNPTGEELFKKFSRHYSNREYSFMLKMIDTYKI